MNYLLIIYFQLPSSASIVITTYTMIAFSKTRSKESNKIMEELQVILFKLFYIVYIYIKKREWGLVILDEVHVVPAKMFRKVLEVVKGHCKLGLTGLIKKYI